MDNHEKPYEAHSYLEKTYILKFKILYKIAYKWNY